MTKSFVLNLYESEDSQISIVTNNTSVSSNKFSNLARWIIVCISLLSVISVALNTPYTIKNYWYIMYITLSFDMVSIIIYSYESVTIIKKIGLIKAKRSYLREKWHVFEFIMLIFIVISVIIQVLELTEIIQWESHYSILRTPRAFILIRAVRNFLKVDIPEDRIISIFRALNLSIKYINISAPFLETI
ncbi:hypothetical protein A3Q56_01330 [Intoshia linei]|uniref:Ion transport domain-containing protein n=1 Tax=Intoshia linei TaxID=1819745 RepID=A0A177BBF9_9BILA|nr:hypothetical protein A3Q56_01330 [Intoshia linei]